MADRRSRDRRVGVCTRVGALAHAALSPNRVGVCARCKFARHVLTGPKTPALVSDSPAYDEESEELGSDGIEDEIEEWGDDDGMETEDDEVSEWTDVEK